MPIFVLSTPSINFEKKSKTKIFCRPKLLVLDQNGDIIKNQLS